MPHHILVYAGGTDLTAVAAADAELIAAHDGRAAPQLLLLLLPTFAEAEAPQDALDIVDAAFAGP
jgi:hypothetical protein